MMASNPGTVNDTAFDFGYLKVSNLHSIYYEQHGNPSGKTVAFLHGGPGFGAMSPLALGFFNLSLFRVVLFDQRGAGKSTPLGELRENTSQDLVQDIETLRAHLSIPRWYLVFGGSWGSTLALLYAQAHPTAMSCLVLRGIFLFTDKESDWIFGNGRDSDDHHHDLSTFFCEVTDRFRQYLVEVNEDVTDPVSSYYRLVTHEDSTISIPAAREWTRQEMSAVNLHPDPDEVESMLRNEEWMLAFARIEVAYFKNKGFLSPEEQILRKENIERIRHIPTTIVQGRYDAVCPPASAWKLYKALTGRGTGEKGGMGGNCELFFTVAGHAGTEPETKKKLYEACEQYAAKDFV